MFVASAHQSYAPLAPADLAFDGSAIAGCFALLLVVEMHCVRPNIFYYYFSIILRLRGYQLRKFQGSL
jgi:hypothetical protein